MSFFDPEDLMEARADTESLMVDECTIARSSAVVTDQATGAVTDVMEPVYPTEDDIAAGNDGRCKTQQTLSQAANPTSAGHRFTVQDAQLHIPVTAGPVKVNDTVTITKALMDQHLVGNTYRVVELYEKSLATAQRLRVKQETS